MKTMETGSQYSGRSLYPNLIMNPSTSEEAKPEPAEQAVMVAEGNVVGNAGVPKTNMGVWAGILILFVVLFSLSGGKVATV